MQVGTDAQEQLSPDDQEDVAKTAPKATGAEPFSGNGPLTPTEAMSALEAFREQVIRPAFPEWDARRSILRPAMIETFVHQRVVDPDEWHSRIPQYLRMGTNAAEKNRFLDEICEIIERIREPASSESGRGNDGGTGYRTAEADSKFCVGRTVDRAGSLCRRRSRQGRPSGPGALLRWRVLRHSEGDDCPCDRRGRPDLRGRSGRPYCEGARNAAFGQPDQTARPFASACGRFEDRRGRAHGDLAVEQGSWGYPRFPQR